MQQQQGRLRLRPWLEEQIHSGKYPGVSWLDQSAQIFQIPWKHAARHGWSIDRDATLFRSWAMHTGRYQPGKDKPDPKTWKANFRCALNSLPDVCELREHSRKRGSNAYRVYRMMPSTQAQRRRRGLRLLSRSQERQSSLSARTHDDTYTSHTWQPTTTRPSLDSSHKVETPAEDAFSSTHTHGMWEVKPEEQEQNEAVFKLMDHLSNAEHWNQMDEQRGWRMHTFWDHWHFHSVLVLVIVTIIIIIVVAIVCIVGSGEDNPYSLHTENFNDLFPHHIKELSDWSMHLQQ